MSRDFDTLSNIASHTAQPRSAFGGTVTYPIAMPPLITATAKVHSADENQVGANNGGGIYRWPEFDSRAGVSRLQPYPRLAHASYSLRKATTPKKPGSARAQSFEYRDIAIVSRRTHIRFIATRRV